MRYDLNEHMLPRISGKVRWEHWELLDLTTAVNSITLGGSQMTYAGWFNDRESNPHGLGQWARYFLTTNQGNGLTGEALVFVYGSGGRYYGKPEWQGQEPRAYKVAICQHQHAGGGTREQERRGYHPGHCALCGLDMTVDSGD
jgi:hypothetical protein